MKITEAIILAGGLGTRLRDTVPELPKCMAPVAGRPFLFHVINALRMQGIERFVFSLGYKHEIIEEYLSTQFSTLDYQCVIEDNPLGTGGAIRLACENGQDTHVLIANGDTLFKINIAEVSAIHFATGADCTLALKPMQNFDRYGAVTIDEQNIITSFNEKKFYNQGLINGGIYILNKTNFLSYTFPEVFSFEKEFLEVEVKNKKIAGVIQQGYFIDIGIPEDYQLAQTDLQQPALDLKNITKEWTLFLDRDGVINEDKPGSYIFTSEEFVFTQGMPEGFKKLSDTFKYIIFVTNQRGVGRELMTETTLKDIHEKMISGIKQAGGNVDAIYYCTSVLNTAPDRKPNPGMIAKAAVRFDDIDLTKAIMVGNNPSDMLLGRNAGIYTVFVKTTLPDMQLPNPDIDIIFDSLSDFAKAL